MKRNEFKILMEDWKKNLAVEEEVIYRSLNEGYTDLDHLLLNEGYLNDNISDILNEGFMTDLVKNVGGPTAALMIILKVFGLGKAEAKDVHNYISDKLNNKPAHVRLAKEDPNKVDFDGLLIDEEDLDRKKKQHDADLKNNTLIMSEENKKVTNDLLTVFFKKWCSDSKEDKDVDLTLYIQEEIDKHFKNSDYSKQAISSFESAFALISTHIRQKINKSDIFPAGNYFKMKVFSIMISADGLEGYAKDILKSFNNKSIYIIKNGKKAKLDIEIL